MGHGKRDLALKRIISGLDQLKDGRVIITVQKTKIVQVEFLDKDWSDDVWGLGGEGI